ncbi:threonylcarbamoyl-AMP synthase, partial [Candidatus Bathyarchaeota archaeon]
AQEAIRELGEHVELAIDGGPSPLSTPSTVVDLTGPEPRVVRAGALSPELIMNFLRPKAPG